MQIAEAPQSGPEGQFHVLYLTGAPAAGKSSVARGLAARIQPLVVFEYGQQLTTMLEAKSRGLTQADLRERSAQIATPADIAELDRRLLEFVRTERQRAHVLVDSHAVTKEHYGFRVTAFDDAGIRGLGPTIVCQLYTSPEITLDRLRADPGGRPMVSEWEAGFHTGLQAAVAVNYALTAGLPLYLIDASQPVNHVVDELAARIARR